MNKMKENSIESLCNKIDEYSEEIQRMNELNKYYRKYGTCKGFRDLSDEQAEMLDEQAEHSRIKQPYMPWDIANVRARLTYAEQELEELVTLKELEDDIVQDTEYDTGGFGQTFSM